MDEVRKAEADYFSHARSFLKSDVCKTVVNRGQMGDLISKQAVIDAILTDGVQSERNGEYTITMAERKQRDVDIIGLLPSTQPQRRDCGYAGIEEDYPVSIREVIDITAETGALETQSRVMELQPYIQPQRMHGHWINGKCD